MSRLTLFCGAAILSGAIAFNPAAQGHQSGQQAVPVPGKAETDGLVFERQQLMLQLDSDARILGMIVAGAHPKADLASITRSIADNARDSVGAFEQVAPGGRSRPEVWSDHAAFLADMKTFAAKAEEMAKAGKDGNVEAVTGLMIEALPCKQCHDRYRAPKGS